MSEEISRRSKSQGIQIRVLGKASEDEEKNCNLKAVPNGEQYVQRPCETFQGSQKMGALDKQRGEDGHKMGLESSRGHGFLWAMVRNADFIPGEIGSH